MINKGFNVFVVILPQRNFDKDSAMIKTFISLVPYVC